jgi:hypothetical protein
MYLLIFFGHNTRSKNMGFAHNIFRFSFTHQCDENAHINVIIKPIVPTSENSGISNQPIFLFVFANM